MKRTVRQEILHKTFLLVLSLASLMLVFTPTGYSQTTLRRALITQSIDESRLVTLAGNTRPEAKSRE